jgi:nucleotide-binding universal stress UspA family protein
MKMLPVKLILSPIDFSEASNDALNAAAEFAKLVGAQILLAHVVPAIPRLPANVSIFNEGEYEQELLKDAERQLKELAQKLAQKGVTARTEIGNANDVGMELLRIAEHNKVDLIVIATHGMTGWHRLAFGSVADKVVRLAEVAVVVLRAKPGPDSDKPASSKNTVAVSR